MISNMYDVLWDIHFRNQREDRFDCPLPSLILINRTAWMSKCISVDFRSGWNGSSISVWLWTKSWLFFLHMHNFFRVITKKDIKINESRRIMRPSWINIKLTVTHSWTWAIGLLVLCLGSSSDTEFTFRSSHDLSNVCFCKCMMRIVKIQDLRWVGSLNAWKNIWQ